MDWKRRKFESPYASIPQGHRRLEQREVGLHNIPTHKASRIVFKCCCNSTETVLIQGNGHLELKTKLLIIAEVSQITNSIQQAHVVDDPIIEYITSDND